MSYKKIPSNSVLSSSSGNFAVTGGVLTDVTNLKITVTTTGRPVILNLQPDGSSNNAYIADNQSSAVTIAYLRGVGSSPSSYTVIANFQASPTTSGGYDVFPSNPFIDTTTPGPGIYTYKVQVGNSGTSDQSVVHFCKFVAVEL